ncbi:hypothetical protein FGIG_01113 [Fasciola gigantica]|uniref:Uncharacterized protein n=1 Tax=Fasciola gigantica TaxID=46835 RepID=A0A504Y5R3_FASGI|nr:hypothetical protein FGIG_01113 [Fasciola gigantica]
MTYCGINVRAISRKFIALVNDPREQTSDTASFQSILNVAAPGCLTRATTEVTVNGVHLRALVYTVSSESFFSSTLLVNITVISNYVSTKYLRPQLNRPAPTADVVTQSSNKNNVGIIG